MHANEESFKALDAVVEIHSNKLMLVLEEVDNSVRL